MHSDAKRRAHGRPAIIAVAAAALFALSGCGGGGGGVSGTVKVSGSTTVLPIAQEAATQFTEKNPNANIEVQGGGSSVGITQLKDGIVDVADSSRELQEGESDGELYDNRIAFDIIGVVVHPDNPVRDLTYKQLKAVFTGAVTNWSELGGTDGEIVVIVRDQASGTREMFDQKALGSTAKRQVECVASAIESASNGVVRETVASTPGAIGYVSYGYIDKRVAAVKLAGVPPDLDSAREGKYPMARFLHMFTRGKPQGTTRAYIDFVLSDKFQNEVIALQYVRIQDVAGGEQW